MSGLMQEVGASCTYERSLSLVILCEEVLEEMESLRIREQKLSNTCYSTSKGLGWSAPGMLVVLAAWQEVVHFVQMENNFTLPPDFRF